MTHPKLFISYSWTTPDHEQWVLSLAEDLAQSGVDVILDKWDLKEGHDSVKFMEQMVSDEKIKKVLIICDKKYADKANGREGGVGTETQIISKEVYDNVSQDKFVLVVREKDEKGNPYLPTYYKSRIYIDLTDSDKHTENFEKLLRWIFDKPIHKKPEIGRIPSFLTEGEHVSLGTTAAFKRSLDAIKNQRPIAAAALREYCEIFTNNLESLRLSRGETEYDELVVDSITEFIPYRNEVIQLVSSIAQYGPTPELMQILHRFFESMIVYMLQGNRSGVSYETDLDNYKFIVHELFLYTLAILIKYERFDQVNSLLQDHYYVPGNTDYGRDVMVDFMVFRQYAKSFELRNNRLGLRRLSLRADILQERCAGTGVEFRSLMQADFVAFIRAELISDDYHHWWPESLLFIGHSNAPFEIFARSISKGFFNKVKVVLGINDPSELKPLLDSYRNGDRRLPTWEFHRFSPSALLGYDKIATRP